MSSLRDRARQAIETPALQAALAAGTRQGRASRAAAFQWLDESEQRPAELRDRAHEIKQETLARWDHWLAVLTEQVQRNGGKVYEAADAAAACGYIVDLARSRAVRSVVKSKSMATEEIELNEQLERAGIEVLETDLGEFIVQVAKEKPSHIIVPAIHKTSAEIAELFERELGTPRGQTPAEMTASARDLLRGRFLTADMGVTGANFAVAETGTLVIVENEGNARLTTSLPRIHVAVMGMEKVVRHWEDLQVLLPLLPASATGQRMTSYVSFLSGPRRPHEVDGPAEFHLILLDAGRRRVHQDSELREALACIRCGACLNACPVYSHIGGHAYGWVYPGPIGAVIGPALRGGPAAQELPFASSLCGACLDACPVKIDIPKLLIRLRARTNRHTLGVERIAMALWSRIATEPWLFRVVGRVLKPVLRRRYRSIPQTSAGFVETWTRLKRLKSRPDKSALL